MVDKTEEEIVKEIVDNDMLQFAATFQSALGKLKAAAETDTNCLLQNDEVDAMLSYLKAASEQWRALTSGS